MNDLEWDDIKTFVETYHKLEIGSDTTDYYDLYLMLGNEALKQISKASEGVYTSWTNTLTGGLTLTGNSCPMPNDMVKRESVWWNGLALDYIDLSIQDQVWIDWRTNTGTPTAYTVIGGVLYLNAIPSGTVTGYLVIRGWGLLPEFSEAPGADNPLESISQVAQLAPAYYILSELPVDATADIEVARAAKFKAKWDEAFPEAVADIKRISQQPFRY